MEICLALLGLIFAYIWRANGEIQKVMIEALERIEEGQKEIAQGQREGFKTLCEMLLNQTKILEKIEARMPVS
ncbi:MAG: hypothetical protein ACE5OR_00550 [bacterium]